MLRLTARKKIRSINSFERRFYSQNGEDGVLIAVFHLIGTTNRFCVEFGVENGNQCNTRYFVEKKGWKYLHMDARDQSTARIRREFVTAENIDSLMEKYGVPREFDLLSIDIDYNTYWVWKGIAQYHPRVVVIEYNSCIPPQESKAVKYDPSSQWDESVYFGASLMAFFTLGRSKGYTLIGCDSKGINAFFVRDDLASAFVAGTVEELYRPPAFGMVVNGKYIGYPPRDEWQSRWVQV